jgi:hypothetical protein
MPPDYDSKGSLTLLKNLCNVASSMLHVQTTNPVHFGSVFEFLEDFVHTHGDKIERSTLESVQGAAVNSHDKEAAGLLESLLLGTIAATRASLGSVWTSPKEQGQGQSAFESKPPPAPKPGSVPNESLAGMFSLLQKLLGICPVFTLNLPAGPGLDSEEDRLLRRAIDSAAASLDDTDTDIIVNAIVFLTTAVSFLCDYG